MKIIFKTFLLAILTTLAVFSSKDYPKDTPKRIDLNDPRIKAAMTKDISQNVMPLINKASGLHYIITDLKDAWILVKHKMKTLINLLKINLFFTESSQYWW